ncbi:MAG TPA: putative sugar nucleotidyl transferase [Gemmatimonadaceae bacterium]|nr:putative sugar nucleotidyl transferase [Gemmatimonadaceae bacterium]
MTEPGLFLYDDEQARGFEPFALTRPASELRAGTSLVRERWEQAVGRGATAFIAAAHLADFDEPGAPPAGGATLPAGAVVANARCIPALAPAAAAEAWTCDGRVAAVCIDRPLAAAALRDGRLALEELGRAAGARTAAIAGRWVEGPWDYVRTLSAQLADDVPAQARSLQLVDPPQAVVLGGHAVLVEAGATVEPLVCFDVTGGPVLVRAGATVRAFTRLVGPCYVGSHATVMGDRIEACSIGEWSRVHGEASNTIVLGHANKSHEGFVGHSYLGRWVNLGAGTTTSNLKNTYGTVVLWTPEGVRDTGMQFLGSLVGDHAKTAIGTRLTTGTVVGAGANVFGDAAPPKYVRPFAWGAAGSDAYRLPDFLGVVEKVMGRRGVPLGERGRRSLTAAYARAAEAGR